MDDQTILCKICFIVPLPASASKSSDTSPILLPEAKADVADAYLWYKD